MDKLKAKKSGSPSSVWDLSPLGQVVPCHDQHQPHYNCPRPRQKEMLVSVPCGPATPLVSPQPNTISKLPFVTLEVGKKCGGGDVDRTSISLES